MRALNSVGLALVGDAYVAPQQAPLSLRSCTMIGVTNELSAGIGKEVPLPFTISLALPAAPDLSDATPMPSGALL